MVSYIKITQLPEASGLTPDDFLMVVDEPDANATTKKVKVEEIINLFTEIDGGNIIQ